MEAMPRHIIISLILLLTLIFFLLLSNRLYTKRQIRLRNLQLQESSLQPSSPHSARNTAPDGTTPLQWHRIRGTLAPSPGGNRLRFTPAPQGQGGVAANIPIGARFWNGRGFFGRTRTRQNSDTHRRWGDDTPSVWGIDLGRRGARGGLRSGAAFIVPSPGAIVIASTPRAPGAVRVQGGRRAVQHDVGMEELPRYEEPPPGYARALEEGVTEEGATPGEAAEGSHRSGVATVRQNVPHVAVEVHSEADPVRGLPTVPEPAVTRDTPAA
ncbi:hypothetical protein EV426DRAFT_15551 [Tirmania nivea]|nr:hypothetical protein EV426DRAFT_15551 [Tirmania nivea]